MKAQIIQSPVKGKPSQIRLIAEDSNEESNLAVWLSTAMFDKQNRLSILGRTGTDQFTKSAAIGFLPQMLA